MGLAVEVGTLINWVRTGWLVSTNRLRVVLVVFPAVSSTRISMSLAPGEGS